MSVKSMVVVDWQIKKNTEMLSKLRLYVRDILLLLIFVRVNVNLVLVNCFICFLMESPTTRTI